MGSDRQKSCEFGPFWLDTQKHQLWRGDQVVPLTPKAMDVLLLLIARHGEIVSKNELMETVWPNSYVEEANLNQNVFLLRKALGESAQDRNYIVTIPGRGYRFAAEIRDGRPGTEPTLLQRKEPAVPVAPARDGGRHGFLRYWLVLALSFSIAGAVYYLSRPRTAKTDTAPRRVLFAVLPFMNLTGDPSQEYLSDGLTEEMITQLGGIDPERIGVIARTSVMRYKKNPPDLSLIGRDLNVDYILEGSLRRDSEKIRITAQLIQMKDFTHVWTGEYDREMSRLLPLQSSITEEIADQVELALGNRHPTRMSQKPPLSAQGYEAYDLYLRGRYFWNKRTQEGFARAADYFNQAIAKDPSYARAYAGLADTYVLMSSYALVAPSEYIPKAREAARRALELDDSLAEAHCSLALIVQNYDWNWSYAEKEFRRAIQLDPNYATGHHWYAEHLALVGRFDQALEEIETARRLDPMSLIISTDYAAILYFSRDYDKAITRFRAVLDMEPNFPRAHMLTSVYAQKGSYVEAFQQLENWRRSGDGPWVWAMEAYLYGRTHQDAKARRSVEKLKQAYGHEPMDPVPMFVACIGVSDRDGAMMWLQKAYEQHSGSLTALKVDPAYDPVRADPRFQDVLRRMGLGE